MFRFFILIYIAFNFIYYVFESFFNWGEKSYTIIRNYFKDGGKLKYLWNYIKNDTDILELRGNCSFWMFLLPFGGTSSLIINFLYQIPAVHSWNKLFICTIGIMVITILEFLGGLFLDKVIGKKIWCYSNSKIILFGKEWKLNLMGYIDVYHSLAWFFITFPICWISDFIYSLVK
jgi:uncharacterized membrane protein